MASNLVSTHDFIVARTPEPHREADRVSTPPAIEVRGISKRYGDRDVLADVSLLVRPGSLHGLLGSNGAGKTMLMRVMLGLI